jgi:tripartite-type tricarboxylate transporter receptor subunit TctC
VPYKGTALVYPEMINGSIQILFDVPVVALPFIKQGRVRALGVSGKKRVASLPGVPTIVEAGIPGYDADLWFGLFAPAKVTAQRLERIHAETIKALNSGEVRERFTSLGADGVGTSPSAFTAFLKSENDKWAKVVKASGAKIE